MALIVVVSIRAGWWEAPKGQVALGWAWLERSSWIFGVLSGFLGYLSWRLSSKAAAIGSSNAAVVQNGDGVQPGQPASTNASPVTTQMAERHPELLDRHSDRQELRTRLRSGPWGVIVVRGQPGIGKSKLVKVVLEDLERYTHGRDHPRICPHEAIPGVRLDIKTLIDDLEAGTGPATDIRPGESSLARFEAALEALGNAPVVIVIECAENLVDRNSKHLVDYDLDEAFEILATHRRHRVTVLLVTQLPPESPERRTWPSEAQTITIRGLPRKEFVMYFNDLDRDGVLRLEKVPDALTVFHEKLQGNLRLAERVYAILAGDGVTVSTLAGKLSGLETKEVSQYLSDLLIRGLNPIQRRVLEVLAAYETPVASAAVAELLAGESPEDEVSGVLQKLQARHIVHRTSDERYCLPPSDAEWTPEDDAEWRNLLLDASDALWRRKLDDPRGIDDLYLHFAALNAALRADLYGSAYERIDFIDRILRRWNCPFLLIEQREAVRGSIGDDHYEMANENALGDLYAARGQMVKAAEAYDKALRYSDLLDDPKNRTKIRANMAMMYWQRNQIENACDTYNLALRDAQNDGNLRVQLSAFEGLADCHRRWGQYDEAVKLAQQALAVPEEPEYPLSADAQAYASSRTVKIALKLARWYAELGQDADAMRLLTVAKGEVDGHRDDSLKVAYLDGNADWLLGRHDITGAIKDATSAVEKALQVHDPVILLQARTTLCFAHLLGGDYIEAARNIRGATRYRQAGRSLIVLALDALVARHRSNPGEADRRFRELHKEATERIQLDDRDFTAWDFKAFAMCGRRLDDSADLSEAVEAFRKARSLPTRPSPGLVRRMSVLLQELDKTGRKPGRLDSVIEAINDGRAGPVGA
ncbi:tetratricopeptide repeat protein [Streptosporangium sp. CA-115845]|uniref:tetratricopeptide repeat protein n=1 Tax=Streptosporangium sp. CA-115845 TaxID=3240071 RepID=UPI003D8CDAD1